MINILLGAVIGALVNSGAYCAIQLWKGQPISWKPLAAAAVGGVVAGALAGTTFGASLLAGGTTSATEFLAVDGALASGSEQMTTNALNKKALGTGVPEAAAWGAITAPAAGLFLRGVMSQVGNLVADASANAAAADPAVAAADPAATAATNGVAAASARMPVTAHLPSPAAHALGNIIANAAFGSPWVGEGVDVAQSAQNASPVDPNTTGAAATPTAPTAPAVRAPTAPHSPAMVIHAPTANLVGITGALGSIGGTP